MTNVPMLILTGTIGAGKSAVGLEMHRLLVEAGIPHAYLDCDALFTSYQRGGAYNEQLKLDNLRVLWQNFRGYGAERLLLAEVIESATYLQPYLQAVPGAQPTVCRLQAAAPVRERRIRARDHGAALRWHLERSTELEAVLDRNRVGDFTVCNDGNDPVAVAREVLDRSGWFRAEAEHL